MSKDFTVSGKLIDVIQRRVFNADIKVIDSKIVEIIETEKEYSNYILPGLIDAHVHIESSMLIPTSFARAAVKNGTVATVSDPHEIANVLGVNGVKFMIENGKKTTFKFYFGAPSCVPATPFETSGAVINSADIKNLLANKDIYYLAEMMNYPGVVNKDEEVLKKIKYAQDANKPIDGHAPGLTGEDLNKYAEQNITTDHECTSIEEAIEKINSGIKIQIREGSAAKDFDNLFPLLNSHPSKVMLCTDDCHPDDLVKGHINKVISRSINKGADIFDAISSATKNPVEHYNLDVGLLQIGDPADFILVSDLDNFDVLETYIDGELVFKNGQVLLVKVKENSPNNFECRPISINDIVVPKRDKKIQVIVAKDGDLLTEKVIVDPLIKDAKIVSDLSRDILKIVVVNRYSNTKPQVGFIKNFNLKKGAIAGSIAHDSHNIIAIGTSDLEIVNAINIVINNKGGIVACDDKKTKQLKLDVAGLMSTDEAEVVAKNYHEVHLMAKELGSKLTAPFMTMAFMALLVIPELKIGDKGLFDVSKFDFTTLFVG